MRLCLQKANISHVLYGPMMFSCASTCGHFTFCPGTSVERLQEPGQGGMEGASWWDHCHGPGDRLVPGAGGERRGNGDCHQHWLRLTQGMLQAGKWLHASALLYFTAFRPFSPAQQGA